MNREAELGFPVVPTNLPIELRQYLVDLDAAIRRMYNLISIYLTLASGRAKFTEDGGLAVLLINKTGYVSEKGRVVTVHASENLAVDYTVIESNEPIGVFLDDGIADGDNVWVVVSGVAYVAMEDNTSATAGHWIRASDTEAGYANVTHEVAPGGGIGELEEHLLEMGHCLENVPAEGAGTHIKARCVLQFN